MWFNQYPYINVNDLNLDFLLKSIRDMKYEVENFVSINAIKYANPIQWDITKQYEKNMVVIDPQTGTAYISVAPVPAGVALTRDEFWTVIFDLSGFVTRAAKNFTTRYELDTTLTATFSTPSGGWLVWGDVLYKALTNITAGDSYVINSNIRHITIEDVYHEYLNQIAVIVSEIGNLVDLTTEDKSTVVAAINEVIDKLRGEIATRTNETGSLRTDLSAETLARQNADTALSNRIDSLGMGDILIVFDSYGTTYGNPADDNTTIGGIMRSISNRTIRDIAVSGSGFVRDTGNGTFLENVTTYISGLSVADRAKITDVVVAAGRNDWTATKSDLKAAFIAFYDYCKANLPNANKFMFGYIANGDDNSIHGTKNVQFINYCNFYSICNETNIKWLSNVDCVLHNYTYLNSDGVHPSVYGKQMLGYALMQAIEKEFTCSYDIESVQYTAVSGVTLGLASDNIIGQMINNTASIRMPSYLNINIGTAISAAVGNLDLFTIDSGFIKYPYGFVDLPCTVAYLKNNILMPLGGKVYLDHDGVVKWNYYVPSGNRSDNIVDIVLLGNGDVSINGAEG